MSLLIRNTEIHRVMHRVTLRKNFNALMFFSVNSPYFINKNIETRNVCKTIFTNLQYGYF